MDLPQGHLWHNVGCDDAGLHGGELMPGSVVDVLLDRGAGGFADALALDVRRPLSAMPRCTERWHYARAYMAFMLYYIHGIRGRGLGRVQGLIRGPL